MFNPRTDPWAHSRKSLVRSDPIIFAGGVDVVTPPFQLKPGMCRAAQNFEAYIYGGYRRIDGYERFDGRAKPSAATYTIVACSSITGGAVGNTLTGATSGATGKIIAITNTYFVVTQTALVYQAENLNVGAGTIAVSTGAGVINGASTPKLHAQYTNLAADVYRALITAVPGSGSVLGVFTYSDTVYAIRNNAGATAAVLHKESTSGWTAVALGRELLFTGGTSSTVADGATLTGATSGASAVVKRQTIRTGTIGASTAVGSFVFASVTAGPFQNGENLQVGGVTKAVANGADAAITLLPGGRYECIVTNFGGSTTTKRVYGCDGVNLAFEFDGMTYVPIRTGMTVDAPNHIAAHLNYLFLSFLASVQFSSVGAPYGWSPLLGATELGMGENVSGFQVQPGGTTSGTLAIFTTGKLAILYGTSSSTWLLVSYRDRLGAMPYTMQTLAQTLFLDTQGVTNIATAQEYGNFAHAVISDAVKSMLTGWRPAAIASTVSRDLAQYRLFFSNGYGLYFTVINNKLAGIMPVLFPNIVHCAWSDVNSDGTEVSYFGDTSGYVHQMNKGTSFDGAAIEARIDLAYNFSKSARTVKKYRDATLEISGGGYAEFAFGYSLGYGSTSLFQPASQSLITNFSPSSAWDTAGITWDSNLVWDGTTLLPSVLLMEGEAENVSISIASNDDEWAPFVISGGLIHYSPRREIRG